MPLEAGASQKKLNDCICFPICTAHSVSLTSKLKPKLRRSNVAQYYQGALANS